MMILGLANLATAQGPGDRGVLVRWEDTLADADSPSKLLKLDRTASDGPAVGGLRRAMFLVRRGQLLNSRADLELVIAQLGVVGARHEDWPWIPYERARAYAALEQGGSESSIPDVGRLQGESFSDAVWHNLRLALDCDPDFLSARSWLTSLLVAGGDRLLRADQLTFVEREVRRPTPDPDVLLVWARHLRTKRQYDSALSILARAATIGGDPSRLALERARILRELHDASGASAAYWYGLEHLTDTGRALYRYDLAWIVSPDSLAGFDRTPNAEIVRWMHRFWDQRDAVSANRAGERLDEHLRRWAVAYARYRARSPWRRAMHTGIDLFFDNDACLHRDTIYASTWRLTPAFGGDLRTNEWLLDQRGIFYLRFGEPVQMIGAGHRLPPEDFSSGIAADAPDTTAVWAPWNLGRRSVPLSDAAGPPRLNPPRYTESWVYLFDGAPSMLNFRDSYAIGMYEATTLSSYLPYVPSSPSQSLSRANTLKEYHGAAVRIAQATQYRIPEKMITCLNEVRIANLKGRTDAMGGVHNDSDAPHFSRFWAETIQFFALGDARHHDGQALVTFALGGDALVSDTTLDGRTFYSIRFHAAAWDQITGQTVSVDTTRRFVVSHRLRSAERLVATVEMALPSGVWDIGIRAQQGDSAGAYGFRRNMQIEAGTVLSLSDIVTGIAGEPTWRATDGQTFAVNTKGTWPLGSTADLFFEVHGVPTGNPYRTSVELRPLGSRVTRAVRVTTTDHSSGDVTFVRRSLGLKGLAAGRYELSVTVRFGSHQATRTQILSVGQTI